ncbi:hypothetical protein BD769DRAFT_861460 [Suillus cothurnatus]|nr:hypothetical protein BD769DRAFT_861460 [Suillus cothurnatus]
MHTFLPHWFSYPVDDRCKAVYTLPATICLLWLMLCIACGHSQIRVKDLSMGDILRHFDAAWLECSCLSDDMIARRTCVYLLHEITGPFTFSTQSHAPTSDFELDTSPTKNTRSCKRTVVSPISMLESPTKTMNKRYPHHQYVQTVEGTKNINRGIEKCV